MALKNRKYPIAGIFVFAGCFGIFCTFICTLEFFNRYAKM